MYRVKVDDQTWKSHVEQLRVATFAHLQHGIPAVGETEWKDGPPTFSH